ncbi:hypothetical protein [Sphingobium aquiterrae]
MRVPLPKPFIIEQLPPDRRQLGADGVEIVLGQRLLALLTDAI